MSFLFCIDSNWTLFLDRDGTINKKIENGYVLNWDMFEYLEGAKESFALLSIRFKRVFIVTNQRGIGRGLMTWEELETIHERLKKDIEHAGGKIDGIFVCPHDYEKEVCFCRKPGIGLALQAKAMFPEVDFTKSIVIGDQASDIEFAKKLKAISVLITTSTDIQLECDLKVESLKMFYDILITKSSE